MQFTSHLRTRQNYLYRYVLWLMPTICLQKPRLAPLDASPDRDNVASEFHDSHTHTIADSCKGKLLKHITVVPKNEAKAPFRPEL